MNNEWVEIVMDLLAKLVVTSYQQECQTKEEAQ